MTHECPVCKAQVPIESAIGSFCSHQQCPSYLMDVEPPMPLLESDLYPSRLSETVCPVCEQSLAVAELGEGVAVWCGYGKCPSVAGDKGAFGRTEKGAVGILLGLIEQEIEQNDEPEQREDW